MRRDLCRSVACALLVAGLAVAQDGVRDVRRAFRQVEDPMAALEARDEALRGLGRVESERAVGALIDSWRQVHSEARAVERARGRPGQQPIPSVSEMSERVTLDGCLRLMTSIERALADGARGARRRAVEVALDGRLPLELRARIASMAGSVGGPVVEGARAALRKARRSADAWVGLRVLEVVGRPAAVAGVDVLPFLEHEEGVVRVTAAGTLAAIGYRAGTRALIDRLGAEQGRARRRLADALEELTGQPLGTASASWDAWWSAEGGAFARGEIGRAKPKKRAGGDAAAATRGAYFGIPQDGESVLYLVDFSKSMRQPMRGKTGTTRWGECVRELKQAIRQLGEDRRFNIVVFAQRVVAWSDRQMPADARNVGAAEKWIDYLELELGTAVFEAFEVAFDLGGASLADGYYESAIDTIFFLSDGLPTVRRPDAPRKLARDDIDLVLALVRRRNPLRSVVLHSVMLGRAGGGPLMKRLAAEHGGTFVAR